MARSAEDLVAHLSACREQLYHIARQALDPKFAGKVDLSGVVQQTFLEAVVDWPQFRGETEAEVLAWLRRILAHNLTDEIRRLGAQTRDVVREQSLDAALDGSSARLEGCLAADQSTPSQQAQRAEQADRLRQALAQLPEDQRRAVELHHLHGHSLAETADQMGRTKAAVASLIFRGLDHLRQHLGAGDRPPP
jgi:RNA polymerase sigma-70 factor (ECF subfamily)